MFRRVRHPHSFVEQGDLDDGKDAMIRLGLGRHRPINYDESTNFDFIRNWCDECISHIIMHTARSVTRPKLKGAAPLLEAAARRPYASRGLLIGSIALNLLFTSIIVLVATTQSARPSFENRDILSLTESLAATMPSSDADVLRVWVDVNRPTILDMQTEFNAAQKQMRSALRREPFDVDAMRAAMATMRVASQDYGQVVLDIFATGAMQMSADGRRSLADWRAGSRRPS